MSYLQRVRSAAVAGASRNRRRRPAALPRLALAALMLAGASQTVAAQAAPAPSDAPGTDRPGTGSLGPCPDGAWGEGAECGRFRVWEDRGRATGRVLELNLLVLRRSTEGPAREAIVLLAGGPGQGGTDMAPAAFMLLGEARQERDILMVDLRGTGGSNPLDCHVEGAAENPQLVFGHVFDPELYRRCAQRLRAVADLRLYTTPLAIDDLDEIRSWLGYEKLVLVGGSYGTRAALIYMARHPERVRAAVLDSPAPAPFSAPLTYARDAQRSVDVIFDSCLADAACRAAYPRLRQRFDALLRRFDDGPVSTTFQDSETGKRHTVAFSRGDFGYALRGLLYRDGFFRQLPRMIYRAQDSGDLGPFAAAYWARSRALEPAIAEGLHISTVCSDDAWRIGGSEIEHATRDTFLGDYLVRDYLGACAVWDAGRVGPDYLEWPAATAPVLILSGGLDPITPPSWGRVAARHLHDAVHLTVADASHGVSGTACGGPIVRQFLATLSLDGLDTGCAVQPLSGFLTD